MKVLILDGNGSKVKDGGMEVGGMKNDRIKD